MIHRRPTALPDVKINRPTGSAAVCPDVEQRITVADIALGKEAQIVLPVAVDIRPHGNGEGVILVGRQLVVCVVHAAQQCLFFIRERKRIAYPALDHVIGGEVG